MHTRARTCTHVQAKQFDVVVQEELWKLNDSDVLCGGTFLQNLTYAHQWFCVLTWSYCESDEKQSLIIDWCETVQVGYFTLGEQELAGILVVLRFAIHKRGILAKFGRFPYQNLEKRREFTLAEMQYYNEKKGVEFADGGLAPFEKTVPPDMLAAPVKVAAVNSETLDNAAELKRLYGNAAAGR